MDKLCILLVPIQLDSTSSDESNHIIIECSINSIPNASISLIVGDSRYSDANTDTLRTVLYSWNSTGLSYVCLANNSISGDSHIKPLDIISKSMNTINLFVNKELILITLISSNWPSR